ncbi:uncharacterized protein L3040_003909 [Drepanopeziza brunnea f. sp. 'multigermtubi']|uniref:uncharacterized protein n=1 Tax=Drepanopeziza brunnea f. sp. 'multigermtubi' TaxID=698441 RepID=UPI002399AF46|nr:hypothetical protein L3040_003909 [Drepanopeziza brunnea f. sp. 'multigermtubi']
MAQRSASPRRRLCLECQFGVLNISKTMYKTINLSKSICNSTQSRFTTREAKLTLRTGPDYDYNKGTPDPGEVLQESAQHFEEVKVMIASMNDLDLTYEEHPVETIVQMIFTSNNMENTGSSHPVTRRLCRGNLRREPGRGVHRRERDEQHEEDMVSPRREVRLARMPSLDPDHKSSNTHAYALEYPTCRTAVKGERVFQRAFILLDTPEIPHGRRHIDAEHEARSTSRWTDYVHPRPRDRPRSKGPSIFPPPRDDLRCRILAVEDYFGKEGIGDRARQASFDRKRVLVRTNREADPASKKEYAGSSTHATEKFMRALGCPRSSSDLHQRSRQYPPKANRQLIAHWETPAEVAEGGKKAGWMDGCQEYVVHNRSMPQSP